MCVGVGVFDKLSAGFFFGGGGTHVDVLAHDGIKLGIVTKCAHSAVRQQIADAVEVKARLVDRYA